MNKRKSDKPKPHKASGERLKECMKLKYFTNAEMCAQMSAKFGKNFSEQYLSQMRSGACPISSKNAFCFAEILKIDAGYLLGKDSFISNSYVEYLDWAGFKNQLQDDIEDSHEYDAYLIPNGYKVDSRAVDLGNNMSGYKISHKRKIAVIPDDKMQEFKRRVDRFIRTEMDALIDDCELDKDSPFRLL